MRFFQWTVLLSSFYSFLLYLRLLPQTFSSPSPHPSVLSLFPPLLALFASLTSVPFLSSWEPSVSSHRCSESSTDRPQTRWSRWKFSLNIFKFSKSHAPVDAVMFCSGWARFEDLSELAPNLVISLVQHFPLDQCEVGKKRCSDVLQCWRKILDFWVLYSHAFSYLHSNWLMKWHMFTCFDFTEIDDFLNDNINMCFLRKNN